MVEDFVRRINNRYRNTMSYRLGRRPVQLGLKKPLASFTFDDFPRSALLSGGAILKEHGIRGSYYASLGMMGKSTVSGDLFIEDDISGLIAEGHELGCHTFGHLNPWVTGEAVFKDSIIKNQEALLEIVPEYRFKTLAYPYTHPHPRIKRVAGRYFECCRGGGQVPNIGSIDLNLLRSCFIDEKQREDLDFYKRLLEKNSQSKGWLIFSTHDISINPSPYGCTVDFFEYIVRETVASSATILPICDAILQIVS